MCGYDGPSYVDGLGPGSRRPPTPSAASRKLGRTAEQMLSYCC